MRVHERTHKDKDATLCVIVFGRFPGLFRRGGSTGQDLAIDQARYGLEQTHSREAWVPLCPRT
jgi:hypothetical protein